MKSCVTNLPVTWILLRNQPAVFHSLQIPELFNGVTMYANLKPLGLESLEQEKNA